MELNTLLLLILLFIALVSIGFSVVSVFRLYDYIQAHSFERSQYEPLFGFLHLRLIVAMYLAGTVVIAALSVIGFFSLKA